MKLPTKRSYHYRGVNVGQESKWMWIMILIGLALAAFVIFVL